MSGYLQVTSATEKRFTAICARVVVSPKTGPHGTVSERGAVERKLKEKLEVVPRKLCSEISLALVHVQLGELSVVFTWVHRTSPTF